VSAFRDEQFTASDGWTATVTVDLAILHVDPAGDSLPDAVEALVVPVRRRFVTVEWVGEDDRGWDMYELVYVKPARLALV
jgi:hypothetical protein